MLYYKPGRRLATSACVCVGVSITAAVSGSCDAVTAVLVLYDVVAADLNFHDRLGPRRCQLSALRHLLRLLFLAAGQGLTRIALGLRECLHCSVLDDFLLGVSMTFGVVCDR